jgi:hypothetical protein
MNIPGSLTPYFIEQYYDSKNMTHLKIQKVPQQPLKLFLKRKEELMQGFY